MNYRVVDLKEIPIAFPRILIAQPTWEDKDWEIIDGLYFHISEIKSWAFAEKILSIAHDSEASLILFPELSIPDTLISKISLWARENNCIIIAGSHYKKTEVGYVAISPVIYKDQIYYTQKVVPAPSEVSPFVNEGLKAGNEILIFKNTYVGSFSILICSDYLALGLKEKLFQENIDILFVPAFQRYSDIYHTRMGVDCESSRNGIYIAYANNMMKHYGDGRSAFFSLMDKTFLEKFLNRTTDGKPTTKIFEFLNTTEYVVLELSINEKRPFLGKNVYARPNVKIISDTTGMRFGHDNAPLIITSLIRNEKIGKIELEIEATKNELQQIYKANPKDSLIVIKSLSSLIERYREDTSNYKSLKLIELEIYYSYILINTGKIDLILKSRATLEKTINNILEIPFKDENTLKIYERAKWLYSITFCLENNIDKAIKICEDTLIELSKFNNLLLNRELFTLTNDESILKSLFNEKIFMSYDVVEEYHMVRRIFEYYLMIKDVKRAAIEFNKYKSLFQVIEKRLDKIYIYIYFKDLFYFYSLKNDKSTAKKYFQKAYIGFLENDFIGQLNKLNNTKDELQ